MRTCHCGAPIPEGRLEIYPDATTCKDCSPVVPHVCVISYAHKTAGSVIVIPGNEKETIRRASQQYKGRPGRGYSG